MLSIFLFACAADNEKTLNNSNNSSIGMGRITGSASIETLGELTFSDFKTNFNDSIFQFELESKRNTD